jgi:2-dehydro-3-deoxyphosphooctonate aldolase (KDO 8-P synthase)
MMQTPAFLVRQTNFIQNVCKQGIPVTSAGAIGFII